MAVGSHDRLGELCSGRHESQYAGEGMFCVRGRLARKTA
jgi:hypothetical protein